MLAARIQAISNVLFAQTQKQVNHFNLDRVKAGLITLKFVAFLN